tara:strand:- start:756 stop:1328 length:573 start_codon:yes stop_codon:yes gene_type:complete
MAQAPYMADSPVSVHKPGTMAQAAVAATIPEGMLIAPIWKRMVALALDAFLITLIIAAVAGKTFFNYLMAVDLLTTEQSPYVLGSWIIHLTFYWFYFKYTGRHYGRSLGQRAMRIAIVKNDGSLLENDRWGRRSVHKVKYVIPFLGVFLGLWDVFKTWKHEGKRSPVDLANNTMAAVDWSLPINTRGGLR